MYLQSIMLSYIFECLVEMISCAMWIFLITWMLSHVVSRIHLFRKKSLKLNKQSFVVITGACMGIGQQMAIQIAKLYHCHILIADIRKDLFDSLKGKLNYFGASVQCIQCDLSNEKSVQEFISELKKRNRKIDFFIHNAGIHIPKRALHTSDSQFMLQYQVNLISPIKIMRSTIELMDGGHIAVVASMIAMIQGGLDVSTYASTKAALYSYVNSFRQELIAENRNVTLSMGCPYMIRTGMFLGFKTKLDFLFRQLEPNYVGKRLVKQFIEKKQVCHVYEYEAVLFKLVNLFPSQFWDLLSLKFNVSNFESIRNRHDQKVNDKNS